MCSLSKTGITEECSLGFDTGLDTLLGFDTPSQGYSTQVTTQPFASHKGKL
ncbi:hypothetical protein H8E77_17745 [bacterium]|nr:hypothetical protein [bacterium]